MKLIPFVLMLLTSNLALAGAVNVEFKFTPYTGDTKNDQVETVAGTARLFLNGVPYAEQQISAESVPVLFDAREISPSVWLPVASAGPAVRKGKNRLHIEFEPNDGKASYKAQLRWTSVMDETTQEESSPGHYSATNQSGEGMEEKQGTGKLVFDREFTADFAADLPWHHYPAITSLNDKDKQALADLVKMRAEAFKPNFEGVYQLLATKPGVDIAGARKAKCLEAAYKAGVRVGMPALADLEFLASGTPEVAIKRKGGDLFAIDPSQFERIKGDEKQMCAGMALSLVYPPHLVVVRSPAGVWEVAY